MADNHDITEAIPYVLSNPAGSTNYAAIGVAVCTIVGGFAGADTFQFSMTYLGA